MVATLVISGVVAFTPYVIKDNKVVVLDSPYTVTTTTIQDNTTLITVSSPE